jgi:hypothetical protein
MAAHKVAENGLLFKSTITEQELFVTLARPRLAPVNGHADLMVSGDGDLLALNSFRTIARNNAQESRRRRALRG